MSSNDKEPSLSDYDDDGNLLVTGAAPKKPPAMTVAIRKLVLYQTKKF